MKRLITYTVVLTTVLTGTVFLAGCGGTESPEVPDPPLNLTMTFGEDDYKVILQWSPSPTAGIDGYKIYFRTERIAVLPADSLSFRWYPDTFGTFYVVAYRGSGESNSITAVLPASIEVGDAILVSKTLCALRLNTESAEVKRYSIVKYSGSDFYYGSPDNEFLADTIDFYVDTSLSMINPQEIVEAGRWSHAFNTKFKKIAEGVPQSVFDTLSLAVLYDETFTDSVRVNQGDIVEIVAFRDNPPASSSDKIYALCYITETGVNALGQPYIKFNYITQSGTNFRLMR